MGMPKPEKSISITSIPKTQGFGPALAPGMLVALDAHGIAIMWVNPRGKGSRQALALFLSNATANGWDVFTVTA